MKGLIGIILSIVVIIGLVIGVYQFQRAWNYTWGYESKVEWTVCNMVKPEYLKEPEKCE